LLGIAHPLHQRQSPRQLKEPLPDFKLLPSQPVGSAIIDCCGEIGTLEAQKRGQGGVELARGRHILVCRSQPKAVGGDEAPKVEIMDIGLKPVRTFA